MTSTSELFPSRIIIQSFMQKVQRECSHSIVELNRLIEVAPVGVKWASCLSYSVNSIVYSGNIVVCGDVNSTISSPFSRLYVLIGVKGSILGLLLLLAMADIFLQVSAVFSQE